MNNKLICLLKIFALILFRQVTQVRAAEINRRRLFIFKGKSGDTESGCCGIFDLRAFDMDQKYFRQTTC